MDGPGGDAVAGSPGPGVAEGQVQLVVGEAVAAVDEDAGGQLEGLAGPHILAGHLPTADRGDTGSRAAVHPGALQADVGIGQVAAAGQQRPGDRIRAHQGDRAIGGGRQPLGHSDADRSADRVVDHNRSVRQPARSRPGNRARASTTGRSAVASPVPSGKRSGAGGQDHLPPVGLGRGHRLGVDGDAQGDLHPEPGAFRGQPVGDETQPLPARDRRRAAARGPAQGPPVRSATPTRRPAPGQDPGAFQPGRTAPDDEHRRSGPAGRGRRRSASGSSVS